MNQAIRIAAEKLAQVGISTARLDAELLLRHVLGRDRAWLLTHGSDALDAEHQEIFERLVGRRGKREPIQYIIGRQEFWGLDFIVTPDALIPRPETELVVESALSHAHGMKTPAIIDLCTGSGCIAVSLAAHLPAARFFATDISGKALAIARENARRHAVSDRIRFFEGDLFGPLEELDLYDQADLIVSNPPYVRSPELSTLQPEVRDYEPETALVGGATGTEVHERIINAAPDYLRRNGALIMEMGIGQSVQLRHLVEKNGAYTAPNILKDLAGIDRVIIAQRK